MEQNVKKTTKSRIKLGIVSDGVRNHNVTPSLEDKRGGFMFVPDAPENFLGSYT